MGATEEHLRNCHVGTIWHESNRSEHDNPIVSAPMVSPGAATIRKLPDRQRGAGGRGAKMLHRPCPGPAGCMVLRWRRACRGEQRGRRPGDWLYPNCSM